MTEKKLAVVLAVSGLLAVSVACGSDREEPAPTGSPSPTAKPTIPAAPWISETPPPAAQPPKSTLAPGVTLPPGSVDEAADGYPEMELWMPPTAYDETIEHLRGQVPTGKDFDGLVWCEEDINNKIGTAQWSWGDKNDLLVISVMDSDGSVTITRGPEEFEDRAGCDVPAPGGEAPRSALAGIALPAGTAPVQLGVTPDPTIENWSLPGSYAEAEQFLRGQLPIGRSHLGLAWCTEDGDGEYVEWTWGDWL